LHDPHSFPTRRSSDLYADWSAIIADLERIDGTHINDRRQLDQRIHDVLAQHSAAAMLTPGPLQTHYSLLTALCANRDVVSLYRRSEEHTSELQSRENL